MKRKTSSSDKHDSSHAAAARLRPGDTVAIINSWSSDVVEGTVGRVAKEMPGGYAIEIGGQFSDARGHRRFEQRCLFFVRSQLKRIPDMV